MMDRYTSDKNQRHEESMELGRAQVAESIENDREDVLQCSERMVVADYLPDSVTAMDVPKATLPAIPPCTPKSSPSFSCLSKNHSDNDLSREIRQMEIRDLRNPLKLRETAERVNRRSSEQGGITH